MFFFIVSPHLLQHLLVGEAFVRGRGAPGWAGVLEGMAQRWSRLQKLLVPQEVFHMGREWMAS